jgi:23S rRNA-intervening sequence protein
MLYNRSWRSEGGERTTVRVNLAKELNVYRRACDLSMQIHKLSESFPVDEKYALTSGIRHSSRLVCLNPREARAKRKAF